MQLISPTWGPLDASQALQALSDTNADFQVIGICSSESSSSVSAALAALLSGQPGTAAGAGSSAGQQLQGLQIHVHPRDRVIVLDAFLILSPDLLTALLAPDRPQPAVGSAAAAAVRAAAGRAGSSSSIPVEGVAALLALQLVVFLLAVCNVVVVSSPEIDLHLLQLLESCCLIAASIPDLTLPPTAAAQLALQQQQQLGSQPLPGSREQQQLVPKGRSSSAAAAREQGGSSLTGASDAAAGGKAPPRRGRGQQQLQQRQLGATAAAGLGHGGSGGGSSSSRQQFQQQVAAAALPHHLADLLLLQCCASQQQLGAERLVQLQQLVDGCLAATEWASRPQSLSHVGSAGGSSSSAKGSSSAQHHKQQHQQHECKKQGINVVAVPAVDSPWPAAAAAGTQGASSISGTGFSRQTPSQLQQLVNKLLSLPRTAAAASSSSSSSGARGCTASGCFARPLSERDWLRGAERVWEAVQGSGELLQYYGVAAGARYAGAGGWRQR